MSFIHFIGIHYTVHAFLRLLFFLPMFVKFFDFSKACDCIKRDVQSMWICQQFNVQYALSFAFLHSWEWIISKDSVRYALYSLEYQGDLEKADDLFLSKLSIYINYILIKRRIIDLKKILYLNWYETWIYNFIYIGSSYKI